MRPELTHAFQLLRRGNAAARERALELLQNTVFAFSMTVCGHREDAEDTMQEVLLKSGPYLERFDSPSALSTWLYKVARNCCWHSRRRSKFAPREHLSLEELMPGAAEQAQLPADSAPTPESAAVTAQQLEHLRKAILRIPPAYRIVLVLHDIEELSDQEVAQVLNLKPGTVRVRLHRARLFVRREMAASTRSASATKPASSRKPAADPKTLPRRSPLPARTCSPQCKRIFANLSNYLDGELDPELCQELERHLHGCPACQAFLSSLQSTVRQTRSLTTADA